MKKITLHFYYKVYYIRSGMLRIHAIPFYKKRIS